MTLTSQTDTPTDTIECTGSPAPLKAPFPYFGGKRNAAASIWAALGDPGGYIEPFAGSAAVLLARPRVTGRRVETINDADGWLVNTWRAIRLDPAGVAAAAAGPVTEIDYHARLAWLQARRDDDLVSWLEGDPEAHDVKAAGWWLYVTACAIGDPWDSGPWSVVEGRLVKTGRGPGSVHRELPHLGNSGQGINRTSATGVHRELPHLGNSGKGINRTTAADDLTGYMQTLADRLTRVRITCGGWERVLKPSATRATTGGDGTIGVLLDPPYATSGDLYATTQGLEAGAISDQVRDWCTRAPEEFRIVLCGYDTEHDALLDHGWTVHEGKSGNANGYSKTTHSTRSERLWFSPACLTANQQTSLLDLL